MMSTTATVLNPARLLRFRRRLLYGGLVLSSTVLAVVSMANVLSPDGFTITESITLALFALAFTLIASSFWNALIGFLIQYFSRDPLRFVLPHARPPSTRGFGRTAVIMPAYNEDPATTIGNVANTFASLRATGKGDGFEFFLLSDSTDPAVAAEEKHRWERFRDSLPARWRARVHYRRREKNIGRKVGNIDDFCRRWGHRFDYMIVLDADSVMSGATLLRLTGLMHANPQVGIVQTVPMPLRQRTLFARVLQFGAWLCSEMLTTGLSYWQMDDGCYFGHNAIIRLRPFMAHCELPVLPGDGPLSGEILSHDFVEAALLRSRGWAIWTLPEGEGSYEELPSNVIDYAKRDRRWCQGNLQHLRLLTKPELRLMSRLHLLMGAFAYLASPLWLALIVLGGIHLLEQAFLEHAYFQSDSLYPVWQIDRSLEARWLFCALLLLLIAPKLLGAVLNRRREGRRTGASAAGLGLSLVLEVLFTTLLAPVLMVFHSYFVASILSGHSISWNPQVRGDRTLTLAEAWRQHRLQLAVGGLIVTLTALIAPGHLWWLLPVFGGLLLAAPLAVMGSSVAVGQFCRRLGLFLIPPENDRFGDRSTLARQVPLATAGEKLRQAA